MISQIRGTLIEKTPTEIIVDCHGVGYALSISMQTYSALPDIDQSVRLYSVLIPRETEIQLFGFFDKPERETFYLLTAISGIGPKTALGILSSVTIQELQQAGSRLNPLIVCFNLVLKICIRENVGRNKMCYG